MSGASPKRLLRKRFTALQASRRPVALETPTTPARGPQVQQLHEIGFRGLLRDVPARQFHALQT